MAFKFVLRRADVIRVMINISSFFRLPYLRGISPYKMYSFLKAVRMNILNEPLSGHLIILGGFLSKFLLSYKKYIIINLNSHGF